MSEGREIDVGWEELYSALEESVRLMGHYATILNQYDGGLRRTFRTPLDWILRLREVEEHATRGQDDR